LRVERLVTVRVDRPARIELLPLAVVDLELALRNRRRREVEHERRLVLGRDRERERVRAEHDVAAERRRAVAHAVGRRDADHVAVEREHRVVAGDPEVVGVADRAERRARLRGFVEHALHRALAGRMAEAVARIGEHRCGRLTHRFQLGLRIELARADAAHVVRLEPRDAVRFDAAQVGRDEDVGDGRSVVRRDTDLLQDGRNEGSEPGFDRKTVLGRDDVGHTGSVPSRPRRTYDR
jgi:hypothetical protein